MKALNKSKEYPVLFSADMVNAILSNHKTQTRRIKKSDKCPFGQVGDILWVRETFAYCDFGDGFVYVYGANSNDLKDNTIKWKPSIFMPKKASRIFLKIKKVSIEKLNEISEEDALKEGVKRWVVLDSKRKYKNYLNDYNFFEKAVSSFESLWEKINGIDTWKDNPLVWVIEFERI